MGFILRAHVTFLSLKVSKVGGIVGTGCHKWILQMTRFFQAFLAAAWLALGLAACTSTPPMPSQQGTPGPQSPMPPPQSQARTR